METTTNLACPYVSFAAFYQSLDRIASASPPVRITPKLLSLERDAGIYSHLLGTFKFFGFIDENELARPELVALARSTKPDRKKRIHDLLFRFYPFLLNAGDSFSLSSASMDALRAKFREHDRKSDSVTRKSANFFVAAADFAGIDLPGIRLKGYKPLDSLDDKRNSSVRENMSKPSPIGKSAAQVRDSEKAATDARLKVMEIVFDAKELPDSERELLAQEFINAARVLRSR